MYNFIFFLIKACIQNYDYDISVNSKRSKFIMWSPGWRGYVFSGPHRPVYLSLNPCTAHFPRSFLERIGNSNLPWTNFTCISHMSLRLPSQKLTVTDLITCSLENLTIWIFEMLKLTNYGFILSKKRLFVPKHVTLLQALLQALLRYCYILH